jgi:hypothetical protein
LAKFGLRVIIVPAMLTRSDELKHAAFSFRLNTSQAASFLKEGLLSLLLEVVLLSPVAGSSDIAPFYFIFLY